MSKKKKIKRLPGLAELAFGGRIKCTHGEPFVDGKVDLLGEPDGDADASATVDRALRDVASDIEKSLPRSGYTLGPVFFGKDGGKPRARLRVTKIEGGEVTARVNEPSKLTAFERWFNNPENRPPNQTPFSMRLMQKWMRRAFDAGALVGRQPARVSMSLCDRCHAEFPAATAVTCGACGAVLCLECEGEHAVERCCE